MSDTSNSFSMKLLATLAAILFSGAVFSQINLSTTYFSIQLDKRGYITSMKNKSVTPNREFSPKDKPSPLLCLYDSQKDKYYYPVKASFGGSKVKLSYDNGSVATVDFKTI